MSDSRFLIEVRITHEQPLEADAQTIADLAARGITEALSADPKLLATATGTTESRESVFVDGWMAAERNAMENLRWRGTLYGRIARASRTARS